MGTRVDDNRNGQVMNVKEDESSIGMPNQVDCPYESLSTDGKMRRSGSQSKIFDNNGGESKADGGGVVNHNGEVGPVTYGF